MSSVLVEIRRQRFKVGFLLSLFVFCFCLCVCDKSWAFRLAQKASVPEPSCQPLQLFHKAQRWLTWGLEAGLGLTLPHGFVCITAGFSGRTLTVQHHLTNEETESQGTC